MPDLDLSHQQPGDRLGTVDRPARGGRLATTICDIDGVGVQQLHEPGHLARVGSRPERLQDAFGLCPRGLRRYPGSGDPGSPAGGELTGGGRRTPQNFGDATEGEVEHVVQDQSDTLGGSECLHDDQHRGAHRLVHQHGGGGIGSGQQWFGQPGADIGLAPHTRGLQHVVGRPRGQCDQPGMQIPNVGQISGGGA